MKPYLSVYSAWNNARKRAGMLDLRMHDLRHSAASNLLNSGQSLYVVSKMLGHASVKTTERYAHLSSGTLLNAVNAASQLTGMIWACGMTEPPWRSYRLCRGAVGHFELTYPGKMSLTGRGANPAFG